MASTYELRFAGPQEIVRGEAQTLEAALYVDGVLTAPSAATVTLYNASRTKVLDAATMTTSAGAASTYALVAGDTSGESLGDRWQIVYTLTSGIAREFVRDAMLVRYRLYSVVTPTDVLARQPMWTTYPGSQTTWDTQIQEAWSFIRFRLIETGRRPDLILSPWSLREAHLCLALAMIADIIANYSGSETHRQAALEYREQFETAWSRLQFTYDADESGDVTQIEEAQSGSPVVFLSARPEYWPWRALDETS